MLVGGGHRFCQRCFARIVDGGLRASESLQEPTENQAERHFHSIEMKRDQEVFLTCQSSFCSKYNQDLNMLKAGVYMTESCMKPPALAASLSLFLVRGLFIF